MASDIKGAPQPDQSGSCRRHNKEGQNSIDAIESRFLQPRSVASKVKADGSDW